MSPKNNTTSEFHRETIEIYCQVLVLAAILTVTLIGNALIAAVIYLDYRLHRPGFYFIANLSAADLLVGSIYIPFYISSVLKQSWEFSEAWCKIHAVTISSSFNASLITLSFISVDRLLAITKPLRYVFFKTSLFFKATPRRWIQTACRLCMLQLGTDTSVACCKIHCTSTYFFSFK